ncbi:hypothetical protein D3C84_1218170 [compost metagenome]
MAASDLDRIFHGLGTGSEQHAFVVFIAADHCVQARSDLDVGLVRHDLKAGV